jgi:intraflagellar transport protein 80
LLQTKPPLIYRAVDLNIRLFRWERALNLALEKKDYIDLVLMQRKQHLHLRKQEETLEIFLKWQGKIPIEKEAIDAKIKQELDDEKTRAIANI